jgi:ribosomal protein S18 acetylase RimI-like enzyme
MSSPVHVRAAIESDLPVLGRLGASLVSAHHDFDPRRFLAPSAETHKAYAAFLGSQLKREEVTILAAEQGSAVVGYAFLGVERTDYMALRGPAGVLYDLVVQAEHRRQGIGKALLEAALADLAARGVPRIVLSTAERNDAAQRLFARHGFRPTMVEMTLELDQAGG